MNNLQRHTWINHAWQMLKKYSTPYYGSNRLSRWARRHVENLPMKQLVGVNLAAFAFFSAVVLPTANDISTVIEVSSATQETYIDVPLGNTSTRWPLTQFGISQHFSLGHPAVDLTAPLTSPIYPIAEGTVAWTQSIQSGYGNHILIEHANGLMSMYAHLDTMLVGAGQTVGMTDAIGTVGQTGWSTGSHLHMEVYDTGVPVNPLEVLPSLE